MSEVSLGKLRGLPINNNTVTVPSGHTLYAPGHVIQVVTVDSATQYSQGFSANNTINVSGLEAKITPKNVNSKIVIQARWFGELTPHGTVWDSVFGLSRNGTQIGRQAGFGGQNGIVTPSQSYVADDAGSTPESMSFFLSDLPATTSEVTYNVTFNTSIASGTIVTNRTVSSTGSTSGYELGTSGMILMEIAQ
jgi:hypothetical protein